MQVFPAYSVRSAGVRCPSRRNFLSGTAAWAATAALAPLRAARAQGPAKQKTRLVLLGTGGGPRGIPNGRAKPPNLVGVNRAPYAVHCGPCASPELVRARRPRHP